MKVLVSLKKGKIKKTCRIVGMIKEREEIKIKKRAVMVKMLFRRIYKIKKVLMNRCLQSLRLWML